MTTGIIIFFFRNKHLFLYYAGLFYPRARLQRDEKGFASLNNISTEKKRILFMEIKVGIKRDEPVFKRSASLF
jgi:hypothetical protein